MDSASIIEAHGLYGEFPLFVKMIDSDFKLSPNDKKKFTLILLLGTLSEGQRILACCSPWGHKEFDTT